MVLFLVLWDIGPTSGEMNIKQYVGYGCHVAMWTFGFMGLIAKRCNPVMPQLSNQRYPNLECPQHALMTMGGLSLMVLWPVGRKM